MPIIAPMASINDLVNELQNKGYEVTDSTVKYYIRQGLLPEPVKTGGYQEGVRLLFDKNKAISRLLRIFELKSQGFKLSEIKSEFKTELLKDAMIKHKELLNSFVEADIDGFYFSPLENKPDDLRYIFAKSLGACISPEIRKEHRLYECGSLYDNESDADMFEEHRLYVTPYVYDNKLVYDLKDMYMPAAWIRLFAEYIHELDTLLDLFNKHKENLAKHSNWPDPDGEKFTEAWIRYNQQQEFNQFGCILEEYLEYINNITRGGSYLTGGYSEGLRLEARWDFIYKDPFKFIKDFLSGHCAFVPYPVGIPGYFLKKWR